MLIGKNHKMRSRNSRFEDQLNKFYNNDNHYQNLKFLERVFEKS